MCSASKNSWHAPDQGETEIPLPPPAGRGCCAPPAFNSPIKVPLFFFLSKDENKIFF